MGKLIFRANRALHEDFGEIMSHECIEIGENLATWKIVASEKSKRDNYFEESLLIVHMVANAVECCQFFEEQPSGLSSEKHMI